jgi:hypothetical protein
MEFSRRGYFNPADQFIESHCYLRPLIRPIEIPACDAWRFCYTGRVRQSWSQLPHSQTDPDFSAESVRSCWFAVAKITTEEAASLTRIPAASCPFACLNSITLASSATGLSSTANSTVNHWLEDEAEV